MPQRDEFALVIGESLIDLTRTPDGVRESVGGSPANVATGLATLGHNVTLATWCGRDAYGDMIRTHLTDAGVTLLDGSDRAHHTSTATASLSPDGDATYSFDITWDVPPLPTAAPIHVHTGSLASVLDPGANTLRTLLPQLAGRSTVSYDPNVRPALQPDQSRAAAIADEFASCSDIIKASIDDLDYLFTNTEAHISAQRWLDMGARIVILTRGAQGASALTCAGWIDIEAPRVNVVDTVGAGDTFMATFLSGMWNENLLGHPHQDVSLPVLGELVTKAVRAATESVKIAGANTPQVDG